MATEYDFNGETYKVSDFTGYDFFKTVTNGTGDTVPRWLGAYLDALADAANNMVTTSASSISLTTGVKTIVLAVDLPIPTGGGIRGVAIDTADNANKFYFEVNSYVSATKTITTKALVADDIEGSGTKTSWHVQLSVGRKGDTGSTTLDINGLSAITTPASGDEIAVYDLSGTANKKISHANLLKVLTGSLNGQDNEVSRIDLKDYAEIVSSPAISSGSVTLNFENGNVFDVTLDENLTTMTLSNPPASGDSGSFTLILTQDGTGGRTVAFPASFKWAGGAAPTLTTTANAVDIITGVTLDGGTSYQVFAAGLDVK